MIQINVNTMEMAKKIFWAASALTFAFALSANAEEIKIDDNAKFLEEMKSRCETSGGNAEYVMPKRFGKYLRLAEATENEVKGYNASNADGSWLMACGGENRFVVEKSFRSASVYTNRGFEGVDYVKADYAVAVIDEKPADAKELKKVREATAKEAASLEMDFVRPYGEVKYTANYIGTGAACGLVSVKEVNRLTSAAKLYDYKVCGQAVVALGERDITQMYANR